MAPFGSNAFFFDVYHDGVFHLNPLRLKNKAQTRTLKKKVVEHVVDDEDIPLVNLVESPILKRKLLRRNSLSPIAKRNLLGKRKLLIKHNNPTTYVVNKGRSVLNEASDKGKGTLHEDANTVKKVMDKGKSKMVERDCPINLSVCRNKGIVIEDNVNPSVMESDTDSEPDPAQGINYNLCRDSGSEYSDKSVDYLLEFEDELTELRKRKSEAKKAPKVRKQQTQPTKEGISSGVRQKKQYVVGDNEIIIEHKEFMDDLMRQLSQDNSLTNPFHIGEKFIDTEQLKERLTYYALANGFSLWFYRSSQTNVIAKCVLRPEKIKNLELGKQSKFKRYLSEVDRLNCQWRCYGKEMTTKDSVQCRNAKRGTLNEGVTTIEDHYGYIRSYAKAILDYNPGLIVKVSVTVNSCDKTYFDRFYVCFKGLKEGWKLGCRKIIALDGCFRQSMGEILIVIDRDANNHIYPMAWDVVNVENKDN
nr:pentatricopeptide repeat-containing protein [Tanacetum cinerariifolium]